MIVDREHTGAGNTTKDVGGGTLEERLDTFLRHDLLERIDGALVFDGLKYWLSTNALSTGI